MTNDDITSHSISFAIGDGAFAKSRQAGARFKNSLEIPAAR
jgi:hypothetical protein